MFSKPSKCFRIKKNELEKKKKDPHKYRLKRGRIETRSKLNRALQENRNRQKTTGVNLSKTVVRSGGLSIYCRKYCGQYKRTCVQDAMINVVIFYGYIIRRELKKKILHVIDEDIDINKAMKEKCVK